MVWEFAQGHVALKLQLRSALHKLSFNHRLAFSVPSLMGLMLDETLQ